MNASNRTLRLQPEAGRLEDCEEMLWAAGALAITLLDAADQPLLEPGPGEMPLWREITLEALLPSDCDSGCDPVALVLELTAQGLIRDPAATRLTDVPERDWERAWMDRFEPMRFGQSIWICPSHIQPDPDWPLVIRLDPGLAFGSGTHPTTALCLEWLDGRDLTGQVVIDYGCGSGVLAIAAALKGAKRVIAVDHDEQALIATRDNATRNGVEAKIETFTPAGAPDARADLVLANILAGTLIELAPKLRGLTKTGGRLVLSGILTDQAGAVEKAYAPYFLECGQGMCSDWVRLAFSEPGLDRPTASG